MNDIRNTLKKSKDAVVNFIRFNYLHQKEQCGSATKEEIEELNRMCKVSHDMSKEAMNTIKFEDESKTYRVIKNMANMLH